MAVTQLPLRRHPAVSLQKSTRTRVVLAPWVAALAVLPLAVDLLGRVAWPDVHAPLTAAAIVLAILGLISGAREGARGAGYWFAVAALAASGPWLLMNPDLGSALLVAAVLGLGTRGAFSGHGSTGLMDQPEQRAPLPIPSAAVRLRGARSTSPVPRAA